MVIRHDRLHLFNNNMLHLFLRLWSVWGRMLLTRVVNSESVRHHRCHSRGLCVPPPCASRDSTLLRVQNQRRRLSILEFIYRRHR